MQVASLSNSVLDQNPAVSERESPKSSPVQAKIPESCETFSRATALFSQSDVVASASVTPSVSTGVYPVPRRRFQRGHLLKRGKTPVWVGVFREDRLTTAGTIKRVQRKVVLGPCSKVSERAAYATFQPYLDKVNVAPAPLPKVGKTLSGVVQEWREQIAVNLKPSTVRAAESHLRQHILPRLGSRHLQEMTPKHLQAFVTTLAATGITRKTIENVLQSLFSILRTARLFGSAVPEVKRSDLVLPRQEAGREARFLDARQMGQIIGKARTQYATMFALLGMTSLRAGEMLGLKVGDLDFSRKVIHIRRSVDSRTKKEQSTKSAGSASDVPMPPELEARLKEFLLKYRRENPSGYVFANRNGNSYSVGKVTEYGLWPVQDALGIPHTGLHAFRHGGASELLEDGVALTVVQRQMRHRDARTTLQKYGHVVGDAQRRAIETLAQKIERHTSG
jgi:integrase